MKHGTRECRWCLQQVQITRDLSNKVHSHDGKKCSGSGRWAHNSPSHEEMLKKLRHVNKNDLLLLNQEQCDMRYYIKLKNGLEFIVRNTDGLEFDSDNVRLYSMELHKQVPLSHDGHTAVEKAYIRTEEYAESDLNVDIDEIELDDVLDYIRVNKK